MSDSITNVKLSHVVLPLKHEISDAKVFTGRQKPMTEVHFLFCEIETADGFSGVGFGYSKRAGGPAQFAHAKEIADNLIGEDPNDIDRLRIKLLWAGASVGRSGVAVQAIAAIDVALWDLKSKRADLPLSKLIGAHRDSVRCYNTSGGFLNAPLPQILENATASVEAGIGGIKIKVGHPDRNVDFTRLTAMREHLGDDFPLMVDANQQWDRPTAMRMCKAMEEFNLVWIEEPLDAYDYEGHAELTREIATPIATGEMLTSVAEHRKLIERHSCDFIQPDAPRIGGITEFRKLLTLAEDAGLQLAPHFSMEIHSHLAATYSLEPWVEHFDWLDPLFNEHMEIANGRMLVSERPGLGITLSDQMRAWTIDTFSVHA
ncbi:L-talarate/galactarate dehydratase [Changpingibacter yushuensis]|uniref:L-talarate/galactarate dehydratase n=1 Tax=Changpingibacter yushuensis TaxID=2758440 RepID=UPI0015F733F9|nr:mandelate racemase/muconate lactonizing enzyme family protein [Changpingibacter yushuensis]